MKSTVLYFAYIREIVGVDEEVYEVTGSLAKVLREIADRHTGIRSVVEGILGHCGDVAVAVNSNIVTDYEYIIQENDEIAFIPPISGG